MNRTHVAERPDRIVVESREQVPEPHLKPRGFWYEVNGEWRRWCRAEMPHWVKGRYLHRVTLGGERLLAIRTVAELDAFTAKYNVTGSLSGYYTAEYAVTPSISGYLVDLGIRWDRVAESWDGIEIAPYRWDRRFGPLWYLGWDCASGVIWRPGGVSVEKMRRVAG